MSEDKRRYIVIGSKDDPLAHHDEWIRETTKDLISKHHGHLLGANIELQWMCRKTPDPDGRINLGKMRAVTEKDRELHGWDAILYLNDEHWEILSEEQRVALLDHELCHLEIAYDSDGEPKLDGHGKTKYRIRKHEIEEFHCVVERHGLWKDDIRQFVEAANRNPLFPDQALTEAAKGFASRHAQEQSEVH